MFCDAGWVDRKGSEFLTQCAVGGLNKPLRGFDWCNDVNPG